MDTPASGSGWNEAFCFQLTLNDGKKDDNDKEEECDVKEDAEVLVIIPIGRLNLISCREEQKIYEYCWMMFNGISSRQL